jgi:hypothetical protein
MGFAQQPLSAATRKEMEMVAIRIRWRKVWGTVEEPD